MGLLLDRRCVWEPHKSSDCLKGETPSPFELSEVLTCDGDLGSSRLRLSKVEVRHQSRQSPLFLWVE
jgi:hypothetical protein